jgi:hypothetical protein
VEPFLSLFEQHIQARIEQGQMRPVDVPLAIRYLFAVNLGLLGLFILGDPLLRSEWESEEMIGELVSLLFDGIGVVGRLTEKIGHMSN